MKKPSSKSSTNVKNPDRPNGKAWKKGIKPSQEIINTAFRQSREAKNKTRKEK